MDLSASEEADRLIAQGNAIEDRGDFEEALALYRKAAEIAPEHVRAHMNAGNALHKLRRWDEALAAHRMAVDRAPTHAPAHFNLGALLLERGQLPEAEAELLQASRIQPDMAEAAVVLADLYERAERYEEAEAQFNKAMTLRPGHAQTHFNFGTFCMRRGRREESTALLMRAKTLDPGIADVESYLLFSLNFATNLDPAWIADRHREIAASIVQSAGTRFSAWSNDPDADRTLRVGYVSGDFLEHPISLFLRPVLERHNRTVVESFCYSNYAHDNEVARVLRKYSCHWCDIFAFTDDQFIDRLRADRIDILIDLSGHSGRNRLSAFARHPAPVQATWLGYLGTTGFATIDYRICDAHTDPPGVTEHLNTEQLVRMPHSQWCYAPWIGMDRLPVPKPATRTSIVFGSFNQYVKISNDCLALWCDVLTQVPDSSLLVLDAGQPETRTKLLERIAREGVDPARISTRGRQSMTEYFAAIGGVDIALDTFPYNGATTTLDTLWMGTPIVALRGERGISRGSYSILKTLGAEDIIAYDPSHYVDINVRLARDPAWRIRLRETLRPRLAASPLMDAKQFVSDLEARYREMWRTWCGRQSRQA